MGVLGDKLAAAIQEQKEQEEAAKRNVNNFIWKGPKREIAGMRVQSEVKLMDATPEQLKDFYKHCISMLYSTDKQNPGRYVLKDIVKDQINKCNTELCLRWLENKYMHDDKREAHPRFVICKLLRDYLDSNKDILDKNWKNTLVFPDVFKTCPQEFQDVLIDNVLNGCLDTLGIFDRRHLSLNFITKLGVWFTQPELLELTEKDPKTGKNRDRLDVIRERLGLKASTKIRINQGKGLTYTELRAMLTLKSKKYSDLTTDQLLTLRNKVLYRFSDEIDYHISQWEERIEQLEKVANLKGFSLIDPKNETNAE